MTSPPACNLAAKPASDANRVEMIQIVLPNDAVIHGFGAFDRSCRS
jgi:hypothetical protein